MPERRRPTGPRPGLREERAARPASREYHAASGRPHGFVELIDAPRGLAPARFELGLAVWPTCRPARTGVSDEAA